MEQLQETEGVNLLTLPRCDVGLPMPASPKQGEQTKDAEEQPSEHSSATSSYPSLLLLQLPSQWKAEDLKEARFVIPPQAQAAASLVVEGGATSFALHRVETSNALVLVPPPSTSSSSSKRRKVTNQGVVLHTMQARLLNQGSGAFFLEPKATGFPLAALRAHLPVWAPLTTALAGVSLDTLGNVLAKSRAELKTSLRQLQAIAVGNDCYARLTEEARLDVLDAVLATLVEAFPHYVKEGIPIDEFLRSARVRLPTALQQDQGVAYTVIRYTLSTLMKRDLPDHSDDSTVKLHVPRVGVAVASRILTRQADWEESHFLEQWQTEMPGIDTTVNTNWLTGHAIRVVRQSQEESDNESGVPTTTTTTCHWKYLPAVAVVETNEAAVVWERLVHAQPEWTAHALQPYLDAWQEYSGHSHATVLRHAAVKQEEGDLKVYCAR